MNEQQLVAVKQALEALEKSLPRLAPYGEQDWLDSCKAITALQSIIAQHALDKKAENARELGLSYEPTPVQERIFCERCGKRLGGEGHIHTCTPPAPQPVPNGPYSAPIKELWPVAPKPWVGLTDEQIKEAVRGAGLSFTAPDFKVARAIEAKLREKNGGAA
jgi:hypothetical protein